MTRWRLFSPPLATDMTEEQEKNMWARLVILEKKVAQLEMDTPEQLPEEGTGRPGPEPPRDRYGAYGRPEEG